MDFPPEYFKRYDETSDAAFYRQPRFVTHIDDQAIAVVTKIYRDYFPAEGVLLDLMSSWISHLPEEVNYKEVIGLGMNAEELKANPRLTEWIVQDLNEHTQLPFSDNRFDGACICVSIDYLIEPVQVMQELARVLKAGASLIITFSNRCFPTKAIAVWHALDDRGRIALVYRFFKATNMFEEPIVLHHTPYEIGDPLYAVIGKVSK